MRKPRRQPLSILAPLVNLLKAASTVSLMTLLSRITGLVREQLVAATFGAHGVSIRAMEQEGLGEEARLVFITHEAQERDVQATLQDLRDLASVRRVVSMLRVVG